MTKRNSKTARIVAALALSAGLFSATNANAALVSCIGTNAATPSCSTASLPVSKGKKVYFAAATTIRSDPAGGSATLTINNGNGIIFTKKISSPYNGNILVTNDNKSFSARIVAGWTDPDWKKFSSRVKAVVSTEPTFIDGSCRGCSSGVYYGNDI